MNLFQITNEYQSVFENMVDPETGEINENAMIKLDEMMDNAKNKGIALASFIKNLEAEKIAIEEATERMKKRAQANANHIDRLEYYLLTNMDKLGITEITCPYFKIKPKDCPVSVCVEDETKIPESFIKTKQTITQSVDKIAIKRAIEGGTKVPGVSLIKKRKLEIK